MDEATLLYRQVHPEFVQKGKITSQVFRPMGKDEGQLSAYDGDQISAEDSWRHYTDELGYKSDGVMAVSTQQAEDQKLEVKSDPEQFPEHVLIDFTKLSESAIRRVSKTLRVFAEKRGWQFKPN